MNTIGDENDSNMEPTGYEYETETTEVDTELEDTTATSEKPEKSKKGLFIAGGAVALLALAGGYFVFSGDSSTPPPPRTVATQPVDVEQDGEDMVDAEGLEGLEGVDRFADSDTLSQDPLMDDFDTQSPQDFDRFGPAPTDPFAGPAPQDQIMDGSMDPSLLPPSSFEEGVVTEPVYPQDVQSDVVVTDSGDVIQDVVTHEEDGLVTYDQPQQVSQEDIGSFDVPRSNEVHIDHLAQFRDMLSPLDGRVTTLESKVNTLEKTVARIDSELKNMPRSSSSSSSKSRASSKRSSARQSAPSRSTRSDNVIRVAPPVSRVQLDSSGQVISVTNNPSSVSRTVTVSEVSSQVATVSSPSQSCDVQAIVPGRVWIKNSDGSFQSFGEDDKWNGQNIESIDPNRGVKAGGKWHCM